MEFLYDFDFWIYVLIGFSAQIVDGALGMAYGTLSTAILLSTGLPPLIVSASVHTSQFFTTGISALSHWWFKNVDKRLVLLLAVSGSIGGALGAFLLTTIDGKFLKPWISVYLALLGVVMLVKLMRKVAQLREGKERKRIAVPLGMSGGFLDALGGGGWGPIVTTSLMARGRDPRIVIGSVNTAEFIVKTTITVTFIITAGFMFHEVAIGLLVGGVIAAPLGAFILRFIRPEILMALVSILIIFLGGFSMAQAFL
jgi:uncharacterized protein